MKKLKQKIKVWGNSFYVRAFFVTNAVILSDFVWTRYIGSIASRDAVWSANWAVLVILLGAYTVISYVGDARLVLAAAVGAWIGTYLGI